MKTIAPRIKTASLVIGSSPAIERIRGNRLRKIRERIMIRDVYTCARCGRIGSNLEVDHIVPLSIGGQESDANRQLLCSDCHQAKSEVENRGRAVKIFGAF